MAVDPSIREARYVSKITVDASTTAFVVGDVMAYNGSAWVKANAATPLTLYGRVICMDQIDAGAPGGATQVMNVCQECVLTDNDAPYTVGSDQYLSGATAGKVTETRPTTAGYLRQKVGYARSTSTIVMKVDQGREVDVPFFQMETTSGEAAQGSIVALDSGTFEGIQLNANTEYVTYGCYLPDNFVAVVTAELRAAQEGAISSASTFAITVASATPGTAHDAITADTSLTGVTVANAAADPIQTVNIATALDATGIAVPGALLAIKVAHDNSTDADLFFSGRITVKVV